ncbi:MAG TPA: mycofactocin biosynthesis glycosyltransferase MftF [Pseudonocardia sp.]|jgi:mycofactocin system glycosyltransferase|uniref:mycofactocin biosynthesis glycosyltransferase MftF n=1 Tax=Pseudonocardia sp. TaxID=60912 RepID=UPI002F42AC30
MTADDRVVGARLPDGFMVRLDRRARVLDGAAALLGLSPGRLLHLAPAARRLLGTGRELRVGDRTSALLARRLLDAGIAHPVPPHPAAVAPAGPAESEVSVVIPVRDRPDELRRLLAALAATTGRLAEVIVVDDGSSEPRRCRCVVERSGLPARVLRHETSRGPSAARNTGLRAARAELVMFLDSDVVPRPGWLAPLRAQLADPSVALAAPRIVGLPADPGGAARRRGAASWLEGYERLRSSLDLGPDPAPVLPRGRVAYVPSAALLTRRRVLLELAGFDEHMRVAEDVDLLLRLHAARWRSRYEPGALVAHEHRAEPGRWWVRKAFYGTGAAPLAVRHPGSVPPMVLAPWTAAVCLLLGTQRRYTTVAAAGVTVAAGLRLRRTLRRLRHPGRVAALLTGLGLYGAAEQTANLMTRHWWPLTGLGCLVSARVRRAALAAALVEGLVDWYRHRPGPGEPPGLDPLRYLVAHRADDLGYGAGLWWGAIRARTLAPLLPAVTRRKIGSPVRSW